VTGALLAGCDLALRGFPFDPMPLAAWTAAVRRAEPWTALLLTQAASVCWS
jgi:hypothetical protein